MDTHSVRQSQSCHSPMELAASATPALLITGFTLKVCQAVTFHSTASTEKFKDKNTKIRKISFIVRNV